MRALLWVLWNRDCDQALAVNVNLELPHLPALLDMQGTMGILVGGSKPCLRSAGIPARDGMWGPDSFIQVGGGSSGLIVDIWYLGC